MHQQVIDELINPANTNIIPGLDRIRSMLSLLDNPQDSYKVIHITGSNGKGSVAAFIECGLINAGYRVGKYTSPHIEHINETILLNGEPIADADLERIFFMIKQIKGDKIELSPFELLTVIMFVYFKEQALDFVVLEVGMGGAGDATNVIKYPLCAIITNIALEHTNWLGNSLAAIAHEKSGIIKNCPVIIAHSVPELRLAILERFRESNNKTNKIINVLEKYEIIAKLDLINFRTKLTFRSRLEQGGDSEYLEYQLSLLGDFQVYNFLCAFEVFKLLQLTPQDIKFAAENTKWNGRLQHVASCPDILVDATHNEAGAHALYYSLVSHYQPEDVVIVVSILADKNIEGMLQYFTKLANNLVFTSITNTNRGLSAQALYDIAVKPEINYNTSFHVVEDPKQALKFALRLNKKLILITGSLYLIRYFADYF